MAVRTRSHHHSHIDDFRLVDGELPTVEESRAWLAAQFPVITFDLTALVKVYETRSTPVVAHKVETYEKPKVPEPIKPAPQLIKEPIRHTFRPGQHIIARNGRRAVIHVIIDQTIRVYVENTNLSFRTIEYYTPEELMEFNPGIAKAA